jgi:hypothetical protein
MFSGQGSHRRHRSAKHLSNMERKNKGKMLKKYEQVRSITMRAGQEWKGRREESDNGEGNWRLFAIQGKARKQAKWWRRVGVGVGGDRKKYEWKEKENYHSYYCVLYVHNLQFKFLYKFMKITESQFPNTSFQFISNLTSYKQEWSKYKPMENALLSILRPASFTCFRYSNDNAHYSAEYRFFGLI